MANARKSGVMVLDTTANFVGNFNIKGIKYIGASSGTAVLKSDDNSSGTTIWEHSGDVRVYDDVCISLKNGFGIALTNNAKVYIYLE
jgi:hypothetical protein